MSAQKCTLIHGDFFERHLEVKMADLVITSPPYNMNLRVRNGKYCSRQIVKEITTKYANFDDNLSIEEYYLFTQKAINICLGIAPLVFYNVQFLTGNKRALFKIIGEFSDYLKEIIVWDKINAQPAIGHGVLNSQYETLLVFSRDSAITRAFSPSFFGRGALSNVWQIKKERSCISSHGAVFPLSLAEKILINFSQEDQHILDPFMGTGTTGVACKNLNRSFTGIEVSQEYFLAAEKRISKP